jgi:hypothetical protein
VTGLASSIYAQSNMTGGNMTIIDTISDGGGDSDDDGEDEDNEGENEEGEGNN